MQNKKMRKTWLWIVILLAALAAIGLATQAPAGESDIDVSDSTIVTTDTLIEESEVVSPIPDASSEPAMEAAPTATDATAGSTTEPSSIPTTEPSTIPLQPVNSTFSVQFINVGQADAALVECDGHYMLIDGGNKADSSRIYSVLKKAGIKKLDIVIGTHAHEDHIGGLPGAFNYTSADLTLCPVKDYDSKAFADFKKYADKKGGGIVIPKVGDTFSLGSSTIEILGVNSASDPNNASIILRIDYGTTSFLFTGDAEREAEQAVLNNGAELSATVLKVGHHGSDTSTTYPFLREIMPQYAVISVGVGNSYGHPTDATLSRLRDAEVKVFRTDLQGDIYCISDGTNVSFTVEKNNDADVFVGSDIVPTVTEPAVTAEEKLEEAVKTSCKNYNALPNKLLKGTLTYRIVNANQVQLTFSVTEPIYSDTEYKVNEALSGIRNYVLADIEYAGLPSYIGVHIEGLYSLQNGTSNETPAAPTTAPTETQAPQDVWVWIPNSGSKYHSYAGCSGMKNPSQVTRTQAINMGYGACKKCW